MNCVHIFSIIALLGTWIRLRFVKVNNIYPLERRIVKERKKRENSKGQYGNFNRIDEIHLCCPRSICVTLYIPTLFRRQLYVSRSNRGLTTMDTLIKEEDEDYEEIEVFMSSENQISDLPDTRFDEKLSI